jgi:hypothetical protein
MVAAAVADMIDAPSNERVRSHLTARRRSRRHHLVAARAGNFPQRVQTIAAM